MHKDTHHSTQGIENPDAEQIRITETFVRMLMTDRQTLTQIADIYTLGGEAWERLAKETALIHTGASMNLSPLE